MSQIQASSVCFLPQMTAQSTGNIQPTTVPAPAVSAETASLSAMDPEKIVQLTQAVAEQVRTLLCGNIFFRYPP